MVVCCRGRHPVTGCRHRYDRLEARERGALRRCDWPRMDLRCGRNRRPEEARKLPARLRERPSTDSPSPASMLPSLLPTATWHILLLLLLLPRLLLLLLLPGLPRRGSHSGQTVQ